LQLLACCGKTISQTVILSKVFRKRKHTKLQLLAFLKQTKKYTFLSQVFVFFSKRARECCIHVVLIVMILFFWQFWGKFVSFKIMPFALEDESN